MKRIILLAAMSVFATGCSTYATDRYTISMDNVVALRSLNGQTINVGEFSASAPDKRSIVCRAVGPIKPPDGELFSEYIRKAFLDELRMAEVYSDAAPVTITGNLNSIDFSSGNGTWNLSLTVNSSNGNSMSVSEEFSYTTSFYGETACNQTAQALMPAVQNLVGKVVRSAEFPALVTQ